MQENSDRLSDAMKFWLNDYAIEPKKAPIKRAAIHFSQGLLLLATVAVHVALSLIWLSYTLLRRLGDLFVQGVGKVMPAPRTMKQEVKS
jgi:hypothetical protein